MAMTFGTIMSSLWWNLITLFIPRPFFGLVYFGRTNTCKTNGIPIKLRWHGISIATDVQNMVNITIMPNMVNIPLLSSVCLDCHHCDATVVTLAFSLIAINQLMTPTIILHRIYVLMCLRIGTHNPHKLEENQYWAKIRCSNLSESNGIDFCTSHAWRIIILILFIMLVQQLIGNSIVNYFWSSSKYI